MSNIKTTFLGKEYSIPADVVTYVGLVDFTNEIRDALMASFKRKIRPSIDVIESDNFMVEDLNDQASKFVRKLLDNDIYSRTANDYFQNNKGYKLFMDTKKKVLRQLISIRKEKLETYRAGVESAIHRKESSVTGLDFGIISSSFVNHMIYAYMDASKQTKQEQEALKTYNREIAELDKQVAEYDRQENAYISDNVIPAMNTVFTFFAYELLDKFVSDLIKAGQFDKAALDYIDLERSNDLLKNLGLSNKRTAILESSFVACPFNIAVYMQAMKYDLLDYGSFQTAKVFKQDHHVLSFFRENWGEVSFPTKFSINYHCINVWASLTDKTTADLLRGLTDKYATGVVKAYSRVADMLNSSHTATKVMGEVEESAILADDSISKKKAHSYVSEIISENIWDELTNRCGHTDLFDRIKKQTTGTENIASKQEFDVYLEQSLYQVLEGVRLSLSQQITERQKREKQQKEFEAHQKKKKVKTISIVCVTLIAAIAIALFVKGRIEHYQETVVIPRNTYESSVELMEKRDFEEAIELFLTLGDYEDCKALIDECELEILNDNYDYAVLLMNNGQYEESISAFSKLAGYKDSSELIAKCQNGIKDGILAEAMSYMEEGRYPAAISTLEKLGEYKDSAEQLLAAKYALANEEMEDGSRDSYEEAIALFKELGNYKDSTELLETTTSLYLQQFEEYKATCTTIGYVDDLSYTGSINVKVYAQVKSHIRNDEYYILTEYGETINIINWSSREELIEGEWITIYGNAYGHGDNMTINAEYIVD